MPKLVCLLLCVVNLALHLSNFVLLCLALAELNNEISLEEVEALMEESEEAIARRNEVDFRFRVGWLVGWLVGWSVGLFAFISMLMLLLFLRLSRLAKQWEGMSLVRMHFS